MCWQCAVDYVPLGPLFDRAAPPLLVGFSTPPAPAADWAAMTIAWLSRERLSSALIIGACSIIARVSLTDARLRRGARFVFLGEGERSLLLTGLSGWLLSCSRAGAVPRLIVAV